MHVQTVEEMHVNTVEENEQKYTKRDINKAKQVTSLQQYMFCPGSDRLAKKLDNNQIFNCNLTIEDIKTRDHVYGTPTPLLQGKMTQTKPLQHNTRKNIAPMIPRKYFNMNMYMDLFFVNKNPFLHTRSENIDYRSAQPLKLRGMSELKKSIHLVKQRYEKRGFTLKTWHR